MIKKLQRRFIRIAVIVLTVAMVLVVGIVNIANWISVRSELETTLSFLAQSDGLGLREEPGRRLAGKSKHTRNLLGESNSFSVIYDQEGNLRGMALDSMMDADGETALSLAEQAVQRGQESAFLQDYLYKMTTLPNGETRITFLNCETRLAAVRNLALISGIACLGGIALAWLFVSIASRKAVEPTIRNMEQQKQFITDASHELKTPLTVISTNMELLQMEMKGNQWIRSTQKQTAQMRHLVDELVYLSRMEEESAPLTMTELDFSALLKETAEPFLGMAEYQGRDMLLEVEDNLAVHGDRASIQRLISTLCDNAVKYAAGEGPIRAQAKMDGKRVLFSISNEVSEPLTREQCEQLFHRFYRADASRSKGKKSGFGIGLSIAAAITEKHGGEISAAMEGENRLALICILPKANK